MGGAIVTIALSGIAGCTDPVDAFRVTAGALPPSSAMQRLQSSIVQQAL